MNLLIFFIVLNIINVIMQTVKSIVTIKCGKGWAAVINALAYGLYTVVTVYTLCDLPLGLKALVVGLVNLVGVYIVKWFEEKMQKDKLWKIEMSVRKCYTSRLKEALKQKGVSHNYIELGNHTIFNCYAETQRESAFVKELCELYHAKKFVTETKIL